MERLAGLDRLRGLAIVLMVVDHALLVAGTGGWLRLTVTRLSLPLFMLVAGHLLRDRDRPSWRRLAQLLIATAAVTLIVERWLPMFSPVNILAVFCVALLCWPIARRWPIVALIVCFVALTLPAPWVGYHPAAVLGLMLVGSIVPEDDSRYELMLPEVLGDVGRRPLAWMVGHIAILAAVVQLTM